MHVSSGEPPVARSFAHKLYLAVASLILLGVVLWVLTLIQVMSADLGRRIPLLAALHPANAMLMVGLTVLLLMQEWHMVQERRGEMKPR
jgi:hypothetical protein